MNRLGDQFFADAGFPGDQHRQIAAADQIDFLHQFFSALLWPIISRFCWPLA